jgi:hypothetical protein
MQRRLTPAERPISFSDPMVRAILDGRKTQTRRVIKPQPPEWIDELHGGQLSSRAPYELENEDNQIVGWGFQDERGTYWRVPYGKPGDRLWVREAWAVVPHVTDNGPKHRAKGDGTGVTWQADWNANPSGFKWKPSIHMPRWASRITLEITGVRVERLDDISEADAMAEGIESRPLSWNSARREFMYYGWLRKHDQWSFSPINSYESLWESINGPESWAANPWVWVVEFQKVEVTK